MGSIVANIFVFLFEDVIEVEKMLKFLESVVR